MHSSSRTAAGFSWPRAVCRNPGICPKFQILEFELPTPDNLEIGFSVYEFCLHRKELNVDFCW